ncbi:MAG: type II toxin-antitoxin system RelE/ParE family toxin [Firmicutes bacterium]|nr:type II toxin-antitoxin system RelE/ParE family toxin [Bacillota bacterium]
MYKLYFYEDKDGNSPIRDYIKMLGRLNNKNSRVNLSKIREYIRVLRTDGKTAGEPHMKHIEGDIWELRPIRNRIFFATWSDDGFILLHHFVKKTRKTPQREIDRAKRNLKEMQKREEERSKKK